MIGNSIENQLMIDVMRISDSDFFSKFFEYRKLCDGLLNKVQQSDPSADYRTIRQQAMDEFRRIERR